MGSMNFYIKGDEYEVPDPGQGFDNYMSGMSWESVEEMIAWFRTYVREHMRRV